MSDLERLREWRDGPEGDCIAEVYDDVLDMRIGVPDRAADALVAAAAYIESLEACLPAQSLHFEKTVERTEAAARQGDYRAALERVLEGE